MKPGLLLPCLAATLLALALPARADTRPDFDDDAKPILKMQPGLLQYVKTNFDVKETGYAKVPGDDDHRPPPPYIFRARHRGEEGPYHITLLIQPGPPGHILLVKEDAPGAPPEPAQPPEAEAPAAQPPPPANEPPIAQAPASAPPPSAPSGPTSDTPSGPIPSSSQPPTATNNPSLEPPPDPAPAPQ